MPDASASKSPWAEAEEAARGFAEVCQKVIDWHLEHPDSPLPSDAVEAVTYYRDKMLRAVHHLPPG